MNSETKRTSIVLSATWQDIVATFSDVANADIVVQSKGTTAAVIFGGASAPSGGDTSFGLSPGQMVRGNAEHVWVKGVGSVVVHVEG